MFDTLRMEGRFDAIAALCLYGQPFGVTQEEAVDLTDILNLVDWDNIEGLRDSLASVLAKVRALLPPSP